MLRHTLDRLVGNRPAWEIGSWTRRFIKFYTNASFRFKTPLLTPQIRIVLWWTGYFFLDRGTIHCNYTDWNRQDNVEYNSECVCLKEEYQTCMPWGWVNLWLIFIFGRTIPLRGTFAPFYIQERIGQRESETLSTNDQKSDSNSGRQKRTNQPISADQDLIKEYSNIEKLHYN